MPIKPGAAGAFQCAGKLTDPHSPSGRWRDDADRQRRGVGPTGGGVIRDRLGSDGHSEPRLLIAAVAMIMRFAEPMAMFISYTSVVELIASALQRIEQFMAIAPLPVAEQSEMPERYDIRFDNVSYRYEEGDGHALNHVSLTFPAASMSALVGASGAGKTTVTKLLMRYADPQQGQISIGGVDIRRLTPEQLNSLISVVFGMSGCLMTRCWRISVSRAHRRRGRR